MSYLVESGNIKPRIRFIADGNVKEFLFGFMIFENENLDVYIDDTIVTSGFSIEQNSDGKGGSNLNAHPIFRKAEPSAPR